MGDSGTVGEFIQTAFPRGNFPIPTNPDAEWPSLDDYSFNYAGWVKDSTRTYKPPPKEKWSVPPLWPPDAFAFSAHLLEQSGAYLRMAYLGGGLSDEKVGDLPVDVSSFLSLGDANGKAPENLSISDGLLKVCRFVGSLWFEGALFISWPKQDVMSIKEDNDWEGQVVRCCIAAVQKSLEHTKHRYHDEFKPGEIDLIRENAIKHYLQKHKISNTKKDIDDSSNIKLKKILIKKIKNTLNDQNIEQLLTFSAIETSNNKPFARIIHLLLALWALDFLETLWNTIDQHKTLMISNHKPSPDDWKLWRALILLLITADEAGKTIGFSLRPSETKDAVRADEVAEAGDTALVQERQAIGEAYKKGGVVGLSCRDIWLAYALRLKGTPKGRKDHPRTVAKAFNDNLGSVLPKARTPATGCTIRSLSLNLALLPPKGRVRARWAQQSSAKLQYAFNILLVPFPYNIFTKDIVPLEADLKDRNKKWGRFDIEPGWMKRRYDDDTNEPAAEPSKGVPAKKTVDYKEALWRFIASLIEDQPKHVINALILPEASIDHHCYKYLKSKLKIKKYSSISLIVAGLNSTKIGSKIKKGNFVATALRNCDQNSTLCADWAVEDIRAKHHRWSLNTDQLQTYALSNTLDPNRIWWENIDIPPREMFFAEFSCGSVLTSLICEDLARIEPCQVALRAVGPNLTIVLLMDSAQIVERWPAQYAGVLSDDPGTSVLTLTSYGLINRANLSEGHDGRSIALWREPHGRRPVQINLTKGYDAQLLTIRRDTVRETTLDGRGDNGDCAIVWRYAGLVPIKARIPPPGGRPT